MLTPWNKDRILVDPFCGSGTFPIEAAMMAANMAPGMNRSFLSEDWKNIIKRKYWYEAMDEANDLLDDTVKVDIQGYDIDGDIVKAARANAQSAGVDHMIHFQQRPVNALSHPKKYGFIISNPPYGERIEEKKNLPALYTEIGERFAALDAWSMYLITSYEDAEKYIGRKADKNRKIYNGMLKTYFYQSWVPDRQNAVRRTETLIKKRIKMQLKKAVSTFAGTALSGILCAVLLTGCGTLQNGEMPLPAESETSRSNDQTEEKTKGEDAEDGEITGSTEKTDDTEEPKTSGTGKTVPEIWNREWPSNVDLPSSYDYREHERAPKIGNQGSLGTCWAFASLTALESTLLPKQKETFSVDHMSMHNHFLLGQDEGENTPCLWRICSPGKALYGSRKILMEMVSRQMV